MADHTYASYVRRGFGGAATRTGQGRTRVPVHLTVAGPDEDESVSVTLSLYGPGEVRRLDGDQIVRRQPRPDTDGFPPNRFPLVEFAAPDLPWLFTPEPAPNNQGCMPWLALVVVPDAAGVHLDAGAQPLPVLNLNDEAGAQLPDPDHLWAWAHACEQEATHTRTSRLLCPRRLQPTTDYLACVVPTYEAGRRQGLDQDPDEASELAWTTGTTAVNLPVYDWWRFRTGRRGDFEALARRLEGAELADDAGQRPYTGQAPAPTELVGREVAVRTPLGPDPAPPRPKPASEETDALKKVVDTDEPGELPPPAYGARHARAATVGDARDADQRWVREANLILADRAAAGVGAAVVRHFQEELVAAAREQAGALDEANAVLRAGELSREVAGVVHRRLRRLAASHHDPFGAGDVEGFLRLTAPAHGRLQREGEEGETVAAGLAATRLGGGLQVAFTAASRRTGTSQATSAHLRDLVTGARPRVHDPDPPEGCGHLMDPHPNLSRSYQPPNMVPLKDRELDEKELAAFAVADENAALDHLQATAIPTVTRPPPPDHPRGVAAAVLTALDPQVTVAARVNAQLAGVDELRESYEDRLAPVRYGPVIRRPLALELAELSEQQLLAGVADLPADTVTAAVPDHRTVAAILLGATEELAAELRWRRVPVPPRWSPFRNFWPRPGLAAGAAPADADVDTDIDPIETWSGALADQASGGVELVILVKGELLRRYPDTLVALVEATWADGRRVPDEQNGATRTPLFHGRLEPDVTYVGFNLASADARGSSEEPGWFVLFQEPAATPGYGLDEPAADDESQNKPQEWADLTWAHVADDLTDSPFVQPNGVLNKHKPVDSELTWGKSSAHLAAITLQRPVRLYIHADDALGGG